MTSSQPIISDSNPEGNRRWNLLPWLLGPLIVALPFAIDFGISFAQYKSRESLVMQVIRPGMTEPEVIKALRPHPFVTGIANDAYYVETKIRRPLTARGIIWAAQKMGKARSPWNTLLPYEMCLVKMDSSGLVQEDFFEAWTQLPF